MFITAGRIEKTNHTPSDLFISVIVWIYCDRRTYRHEALQNLSSPKGLARIKNALAFGPKKKKQEKEQPEHDGIDEVEVAV